MVTRLKSEAGQRSKFANLHSPPRVRTRLPKTQVHKLSIHSAPSSPSPTYGGLSSQEKGHRSRRGDHLRAIPQALRNPHQRLPGSQKQSLIHFKFASKGVRSSCRLDVVLCNKLLSADLLLDLCTGYPFPYQSGSSRQRLPGLKLHWLTIPLLVGEGVGKWSPLVLLLYLMYQPCFPARSKSFISRVAASFKQFSCLSCLMAVITSCAPPCPLDNFYFVV